MRKVDALLSLLVLPVTFTSLLRAQDAGHPTEALTGMSLEQLTQVTVSSVARRDQKLSRVAAAAYIITSEEIHRSGLSSIPELLRRVPGLQVARIDANKWAVSSRGFNGRFANKMLVMIDGRSIYNNESSGVYWDQNDVLIEDVERIEIIRGPGASMWGENAVNGVINIIMKKARATPGGLVRLRAGGDEVIGGAIRYGGMGGEHLQYRAYVKSFDLRAQSTSGGSPANDGWNSTRGGGRVDWEPTEHDRLSFSGDIFEGQGNQTVNRLWILPGTSFSPDRFNIAGGYGSARWEHSLKTSDLAFQFNYTRGARSEELITGFWQSADFDFQHHFAKSAHDFVWGAAYQLMSDRAESDPPTFDPPSRTDQLTSFFFQDDFTLIPDRLVLTFGSKFLHSSYTRIEVQPGLRLLWAPVPRHSWWASFARAVRPPARNDRDVHLDFDVPAGSPVPVEFQLRGNPHSESETMLAYEAGHRSQIGHRLSFDVAAFVNVYRRLAAIAAEDPRVEINNQQLRIIYPLTWQNSGSGHSRGVETALNITVNSKWKLQAGYAWMEAHLKGPAQGNRSFVDGLWLTPHNTFSMRSSLDIGRRWNFDSSLYYVSRIQDRPIPQHVRADVRVAWKAGESLEISGGVQNVQSARQFEFPTEDFAQNSAVRRAPFVRILWTF